MAKLLNSRDVFISEEVIVDVDPIEFYGGRNIGPLPTLYGANGLYIEPVNHWFIHLIAAKRLENISSYSRALLRYWSFLEKESLAWDQFPPIKSLKPTYRFRNEDLLNNTKNGSLAYSTANTYMNHVVQFYRWAAHEQFFSVTENNKPFEIEFIQVKNNGMLAHMMPKFVVQTSDLRIRVPRDAASNQINSLNPLTREMLTSLSRYLHQESPETRLIVLLGVQCGLRIEEAAGLTISAINQAVPISDSRTRYQITIGPGNGVPTKYNKTRIIEIPHCLLETLQRYAIGERRLNRLDKLQARIIKCKNDCREDSPPVINKSKLELLIAAQNHEPLFISQAGNPLHPKVLSTRFGEMRKAMLAKEIPFNHRFHDLRCSYATYRLQSLLDSGIEVTSALDLLMQWMGHNHESTTWKYLRYIKRKDALKEKIFMLDSIMYQALIGIDYE